MEEIIKDLELTGYITNKKIGNFFHIKYSELYKKIFNITKDIESTYVVNTTLRARVIFLLKYNCNTNLLKYEDKWLTFDRKKDDFIKKSLNSAKKGWDNKIKLLEDINILSLNDTINKLKQLDHDNIFGKGKNRILLSKDPILYKSIEEYSKDLTQLNKPSNKFPSKILFIKDYNGKIENLVCPVCKNNYCLYSETKKLFNDTCKTCYHSSVAKYPQKSWFIKKYGNEWLKYYNEDRERIKSIQVNSESWFTTKYGLTKGKELRKKYIEDRIENIINLSNNRVSNISQELFWSIYNQLPSKINCYFHELNKEIFIKKDDTIYFPDFIYNNKIIEYDGLYWHNEEKDKKRNKFYEKMGYKLFIVNSNEFNRNKKDEKIITKCLKFLLDEE